PMAVKMIRQLGYAPEGSRLDVFVLWLVPTAATASAFVYTGSTAEGMLQRYLICGTILAFGSLVWYSRFDRTALFSSRELLDKAIHARRSTAPKVGAAYAYRLGHLLVVALLWPFAPLVQWLRR